MQVTILTIVPVMLLLAVTIWIAIGPLQGSSFPLNLV
jgi:hypothetical protein